MTYNPDFSFAMIEARSLSDTMTGAAVHHGAEREADLALARKQFVALGVLLLKLSERASAEVIPLLSRTARVPLLVASGPLRAMSPEGAA